LRRAIALAGKSFVATTTREVALSYLRIELGGRRPEAAPLQQRIAGFDVTFLSYRTLRKLFEEIFIDQDYCFVADSERPLIIDCGSNIGLSILYFKRLYPQARVIGFEPFIPAFEILSTNVAVNRLEDVRVYNLAVSRTQGRDVLHYDPADPGSLRMSLIADRLKGAPMPVNTTTLSSYIDEPVDLLKLDIEGAETAVLQELHASGKLPLIKKLLIEYHHHIHPECDAVSGVLDLLECNQFGYLIRGSFPTPVKNGKYQDIMIHAYRKPG
jgi:FkbM family methyltransferase